MTYQGSGQTAFDNPLWDGTKWVIQHQVRTEDGAVPRQTLSWGLVGDTTFDFTAALTVAGSSFGGVFLDSQDVWVCDYGTPLAVTRVDWATLATDLTVNAASLGFTIKPISITSDGLDIFFASNENPGTPRVVQINRSTGAHIANFTPPSSELPIRMAFDGEKVWFLTSTHLYRIDNFTGPVLASPASFTPTNLFGMIFDGRYMWVVDRIGGASVVYQIDPYPATPTVVATFTTVVQIADITFDGTWIWVVSDSPDGTVIRIHSKNGVTETISISAILTGTTTISFNGLAVYVGGSTGHVRLNPVNGRSLNGAAFPGGVSGAAGTGFMKAIGLRSLLLTNGTIIYRNDIPRNGAYQGMLLGGDAATGIYVPQQQGEAFALGTVSGTVTLPSRSSVAAYLILTGTLTGATRLEPESGNFWMIQNTVSTGGNSFTFGSSGSNVTLGTSGTFSIIRMNTSGTFVLLNVFP